MAPAGCFWLPLLPPSSTSLISLLPPRLLTVHNVSQMTGFKTQHPALEKRGEEGKKGQGNHRRFHPLSLSLPINPPRLFVSFVFRLPSISLCTKQSRLVDHLSFWLPVTCLFAFLAVRMFAMCHFSFFSHVAVGFFVFLFPVLHSLLHALLFSHSNVATEPSDRTRSLDSVFVTTSAYSP